MDGENFGNDLTERLKKIIELLEVNQTIAGEALKLVDFIESNISILDSDTVEKLKATLPRIREVAEKEFQAGIL